MKREEDEEKRKKERKRKKTKHEKGFISFLVIVPASAAKTNAMGKCARVYNWQDLSYHNTASITNNSTLPSLITNPILHNTTLVSTSAGIWNSLHPSLSALGIQNVITLSVLHVE